jgi:hypothetical protein
LVLVVISPPVDLPVFGEHEHVGHPTSKVDHRRGKLEFHFCGLHSLFGIPVPQVSFVPATPRVNVPCGGNSQAEKRSATHTGGFFFTRERHEDRAGVSYLAVVGAQLASVVPTPGKQVMGSCQEEVVVGPRREGNYFTGASWDLGKVYLLWREHTLFVADADAAFLVSAPRPQCPIVGNED